MMKVNLAGFNVDAEVLKEAEKAGIPHERLTPETLSAAYARISRDPRPVDELRKEARSEVEKSRKSNRAIIFKMGHHSVAEHAVFNFDVLGISRLCMEELEKFRLCSYTEKSQRYITLDSAFVVPEEIQGTAFEKPYNELISRQFDVYGKVLEKLKTYIFEKNPAFAADKKKHSLLEGWAKEDARYITPLATEAQLGMTVNARNLEFMLRRFASHPRAELRNLGRALFNAVEKIAPSIILFHQANDMDQKTYPDLRDFINTIGCFPSNDADPKAPADVERLHCTDNADAMIIHALMHSVSGESFHAVSEVTKSLNESQKKEILKAALTYLEFYDTVPREFEYASIVYQLTVSAACFGQLKRHRMATMTMQGYHPSCGVTIPDAIATVGMEKEFMDIIRMTDTLFGQIYSDMPAIASYILTNAHRRRVLMSVNVRELYHMSRLREDSHAQWDIRRITGKMVEQAREVMPLSMMLAGGKDSYHEVYRNVYGVYPKVSLQESTVVNKAEHPARV